MLKLFHPMPAQRKRRTTTRHSHRRSNDPEYEDLIQETTNSIAQGVYPSYTQAAAATKIPKSTLLGRARNRHSSWQEASAQRQLLTLEEEGILLDWCALHASLGNPWTPEDLRAQAELISGKQVGSSWHKKFERRHPKIDAYKATSLDPKRANHFNRGIVMDFFDKWESLNDKHGGIPPEHIWNWDEKGIQMGGGRGKDSQKHYFLKSSKHRYLMKDDNLELVTILECVSAAGSIVPPSFCLQNGPYPDVRKKIQVHEWGSLYMSESGWTDSVNAERWLDTNFIPWAKEQRVDNTKPIVLFMDGHETHETLNMKRTVYKYLESENIEVVLFCFPSKTTHKLQPLDVGIFHQVQRHWQADCSKGQKVRRKINQYTVIPAYVHATRKAMDKETIAKAFKNTGIFPANRDIFTNDDFAPSRATSAYANVPDSYPLELRSSSPFVPSDAESDSDYEQESDGSMMDASADDSVQPESETDNPSTPSSQPRSGLLSSLSSIDNKIAHSTRSSTPYLQNFSMSPPKGVSLEEDKHLTPDECLTELRSLRQQLTGAYRALTFTATQLNAANAHCTSIRQELDDTRSQLQNATKKRERGSNKIKARFVTLRELQDIFDQQDLEQQEREQADAEKSRRKEETNAQTARRVADDAANGKFLGRLSSYKKDDLRALALALGLADQGDKKEITARIEAKFGNAPELKTNERYKGLFDLVRRRKIVQETREIVDEETDSEGESEYYMTPTPPVPQPGPSNMNRGPGSFALGQPAYLNNAAFYQQHPFYPPIMQPRFNPEHAPNQQHGYMGHPYTYHQHYSYSN
ncbi:hypothetical protein D9619_009916 [Psilocybe cf. subviscida]|uniref:HTH CENPB-type domain-containing protein n=1 Tax=Psilocybe cf. subviscida TaxID=2480587 RepID=A0A8H5BMB8_9AGAR|nr:hypothetical protein D9619_009916 [Psilocybe cf. subviscida]